MHIVIQRNGNLVVRERGAEDNVLDPSDPFAIVDVFRAVVELEEGISPFQMMRAMKPWSGVLSEAGWLDFDEWFKAMERPFVQVAGDEADRLAGIEIYPVVDVRRTKCGDIREAEVSVSWRPRGRYLHPVEGHGDRIDAYCSLSFVDPRLLGHLPVTIVREASVNDTRACAPWREVPVLPSSIPRVYDRLVCTPTFFDTVVLGFLDDISVHGTPETTQEVADELRHCVDRIKAGDIELAEPQEPAVSILETLGVLDDDDRMAMRRHEAAVGLAESLAGYSGPPAVMADALGLTEYGLADLAGGNIARFTDETLKRFAAAAKEVLEKGGR